MYRDGLRGSAEVGQIVQLIDGRDEVAWGLFDEGNISIRVLGRGRAEPLDEVLKSRIQRADGLRVRLVTGDTDCWRAVNAAGDGLPGLVVDRYGELAVLRIYAKAWERHLAHVVDAIRRLGWVGRVYRRLGVARVDGRKGGEVLHGGDPGDALTVKEHGVVFLVRPKVGQKTGLFLDQRENRRRVGELSAGRQVLNLFGYNGGFSVYAALAGASRVVTVDRAPAAIEDAREIFRLNGLPPERHGFEVADVFKYQPRGRMDLVVCDPPALTRDKSKDGAARKAYTDLNAKVAPLVPRDGLLATASCTARLDRRAWEGAVEAGLRGHGQWSWLEHWGPGPDHPSALGHPEGRYLKMGLLRRRA